MVVADVEFSLNEIDERALEGARLESEIEVSIRQGDDLNVEISSCEESSQDGHQQDAFMLVNESSSESDVEQDASDRLSFERPTLKVGTTRLVVTSPVEAEAQARARFENLRVASNMVHDILAITSSVEETRVTVWTDSGADLVDNSRNIANYLAESSNSERSSVSSGYSDMPSLTSESFRAGGYLSDVTSRTGTTEELTDASSITTIGSDLASINTNNEESELSTIQSTRNDAEGDGLEYQLSVVSGEAQSGIMDVLKNKNTWIIDSGASGHSTGHADIFSVKRTTDASTVGATGPAVAADFEGDIQVAAQDKNGTEYRKFKLTNVTCKKTANFNLMSMGAMLVAGWESRGTADMITLTKGEVNIKFDVVVKTKRGAIYCATLVPRIKKGIVEVEAINTTEEGVTMSYDRAHELLGHTGEATTRATARTSGWILTPGNGEPCK